MVQDVAEEDNIERIVGKGYTDSVKIFHRNACVFTNEHIDSLDR